MAAVAAGLLGVEGGMLWIVFGVWTVRAVWGQPPGLAWGLACVAAGLRWSTFALLDLEASTRSLGPALAVEPMLAAGGAAVALAGAMLEESARAGLRASSVPERAVAAAALLTLVPAFLVPGPGAPGLLPSLGLWVLASFAVTVVAVSAAPLARRVPLWIAPALAIAGASAIVLSR